MRQAAVSLFCGVVLAACGSGSSAPAPYTLVAFDHQGDLYRINPATGAVTQIVDTFYQPNPSVPATELWEVSSSIYNDQTGEIWMGSGGRGACDACMFRLDLETGEAVCLVSNLDVYPSWDNGNGLEHAKGTPGMAMGADGAIYTRLYNHSNALPQSAFLYQIDESTGRATNLGQTFGTGSGNGMVYDDDGVLYAIADQTVYWIDLVGDPSADPPRPPYRSIEMGGLLRTGFPLDDQTPIRVISAARMPGDNPNQSTFYCMVKEDAGRGEGKGSAGKVFLAKLDLNTYTVTHIAQLALIMDGLAVVPTSVLP